MTRVRDPIEPRRAWALRWAGAGLFVVAAHVGCTALALMQWPEEAEEAAAGLVIVEMVPAPTPVDSPDVAHGPRVEEAKLTPQAAEKVEQEAEKEAPPIEPSPAPEPEVVLPKPVEPQKEPEEERPKEEVPQQQSPEPASAAPLTTAPPRVEARAPPVPAAPAPGASAQAARKLMATWEKALVSHLNRFKRYPGGARSRGSQGAVNVQFTVDRAGQVMATRIVRSSGSAALDEEAAAVPRRASPLPAPPAQFGGATFDLTLPIHFQIK